MRYFEWTEDMTQEAEEKLANEGMGCTTDMLYRRLEIEAKKHWDIYYKQNTVNGYKDRHYIKTEFSELTEGVALAKEKGTEVVLLDLGCGVGNAFYPLVNEFGCPPLRVQCCDFSPRAVGFVKEHESFKKRIHRCKNM